MLISPVQTTDNPDGDRVKHGHTSFNHFLVDGNEKLRHFSGRREFPCVRQRRNNPHTRFLQLPIYLRDLENDGVPVGTLLLRDGELYF